ncbi:MAG: cytochrome C oxidase subunit IV family protein [Martelella sp.]|uniref:cytochrome C oxidase subunit IV family protein n=1 Tax=Martelella sp. TaxID=1969699 RepID=UPI0032426A2E
MRQYLRISLVWLLLAALLGLTVLSSYVLTGPPGVLAGIVIATMKAVLVLWFFMNMREETPMVRLFSTAALFWLAALLLLTFSDYVTRGAV